MTTRKDSTVHDLNTVDLNLRRLGKDGIDDNDASHTKPEAKTMIDRKEDAEFAVHAVADHALEIQPQIEDGERQSDGRHAMAHSTIVLQSESIHHRSQQKEVFLKIVPIMIHGPTMRWQRSAALATRSSFNIMRQSVASKIGLDFEPYDGDPIPAFGHDIKPTLQTTFHWHFADMEDKGYIDTFAIIEDKDLGKSKFEIIFSLSLILKRELYTMNDEVLQVNSS
ncbi:MAG: hypothetical protein Q9182_006106 [Xanthomendoza sp. 2 TL-2023]